MAVKLLEWQDSDGELKGYYLKCPACGFGHVYYTKKFGSGTNPVWQFNGDLERPTFKPSLLARAPYPEGERRCHFFVTDGMIQFCNDTTNKEYAGKTVEMEDVLKI